MLRSSFASSAYAKRPKAQAKIPDKMERTRRAKNRLKHERAQTAGASLCGEIEAIEAAVPIDGR